MKNSSLRHFKTSSLHQIILLFVCSLTIVGCAQELKTTEEFRRTVKSAAVPYPHVFEEVYAENDLDFIVVGDWGYQGKGVGKKKGDQVHVAFAMERISKNFGTQFIINVGDTNVFYYDYKFLDNKNSLKSNLYDFGINEPETVDDRLKWIEEKLEENQDSKWIFVVEYQSAKPSSPTTYFTSGCGSRFGPGCAGRDWGVPLGTFGFLHVRIKGNSSELNFEYVNATTYKSKIVHQ
ncbi:432_t:CDS:2, partial [Acaulospora colombiana]